MATALGETHILSSGDVASEPSRMAPLALQKHHDLVKWLIKQGGSLHEDVVIAYQADKGYHAVVGPGKTITKNTRIASCPMETTLCVLNPLDVKPFSSHGVRFPQPFLDKYCTAPEILQSFFLMEHQLQGEKSWWATYIATLPSLDDVKDLQFESVEDRQWIQGTNLEGALELQLQKWRENWAEGLETLKQYGWANAENDRLSWELFRWATTMFGTRSFTSQVLSDSTPADIARPLGREEPAHQLLSKLFAERFAVILPVLDILNHRPAAQIEWQARHDFVGLQVLETYVQGQELFNNYGPRDNESLLLSYGFVLENNPFDHLVVSIRVPEGSPLADARTWIPDARSNEQFNCYIFGPDHPIVANGAHLERAFFSYDLLDSISVLTGNDRELGMMYNSGRTLMSMCLPDQFPDFHNILGAISQLLQDVRARARRLQMTDPTQMSPPLQARSQKQWYAQQYRLDQLRILQNAIAVCAFVILRACTDLRTMDIVLTMQTKIPHFYSPDIDRIVLSQRCLTRQHELVTVDEILRLIPRPITTTLETCIQEITTALQIADHLPANHSDTIKAGFAIALSAVCHEFSSGTQLGHRLSSWFEDLTQWYPPNDENWAYVPHSGPYEPGEQPPQALMRLLSVVGPIVGPIQSQAAPNSQIQQWLRPEMLCWGWNVMEEEGVRVPTEIERFCNGIIEAELEEGAIGFLMYCKWERQHFQEVSAMVVDVSNTTSLEFKHSDFATGA